MVLKFKLIFCIITFALCFLSQGAFAFTKPDWKLVVYMQADNDLYEFALKDIEELKSSILNSSRVEAYVFLDTPGNLGKSIFKISQYGIKTLAYIKEETTQASDLELLLKIASSNNSKTLFTFWGHGEGWSADSLAQFGGISLDDYPVSKLTIPEIANVLKSLKKIEIIAMDACLMQTVEVAYELKDDAEYISGSTQIQNWEGFSYNHIIKYIDTKLEKESKRSSSSDSFYLAKMLVNINDENSTDQNRTLNVINTDEFKNILIPSINKSFQMFSEFLNENFEYKLLFNLQIIPSFLGESKDLSLTVSYILEFLEKIDTNIVLKNQFNKLKSSINRTVLNYKFGPIYILNNDYYLGQFKAFGIWIPSSKSIYDQRIYEFQSSSFYKNAPGWNSFLRSIYEQKLLIF
jgi:hypothetical protein